jgi:ribosomal protein L40E
MMPWKHWSMATDPTKVEFLEYCRLVLKGEEPASGLATAIKTARENLDKFKESFLNHFTSLPAPIQEKCKREQEDFLAAMNDYLSSLAVVEKYLQDANRVTLVRGMEFVRRALEQINVALYRYRASVLAAEGPTDMPNYNLFYKVLHDFKNGSLSEKEVKPLIQAARISVERAIGAVDRFKGIPEVAGLIQAFQKHQECLNSFEDAISTGKSFDEPLEIFKGVCEAMRNLQGPAQWKILSQGPTPSETANRIINISLQVLTGKIHPTYLSENLKQLEGEYSAFKRQFETLQAASTPREAELLKDAFQESKTGMELYEKAIAEFHRFEERMDVSILMEAMRILQDAVLKLHNVYEMISDMAEREGKILCVRCQHYNAPDRKNCEKCGAILPRMIENQNEQSNWEVREALLSMPLTENIKMLLDAGEGVTQGAVTPADFEQMIARMESLIHSSLKQADDFWKSEAQKRKNGFTESEEAAYSFLKNGSQEILEGLSYYRRYLESQDATLIREGAKRIVLGAHKVYQISKVASQTKTG